MNIELKTTHGKIKNYSGIVQRNPATLFSRPRGKERYHIIVPAKTAVGGKLYLYYGVMGGFMQPL